MDGLIQTGIEWVIAIQALGGWLEAPMKFFSFLGSEDFFFLVLPLIYWSVNPAVGLQVAAILALSNNLKDPLKMFFADPRPYWVSGEVEAFVHEDSFGIPSGHAQDAVAIWGTLAAGIRRRWASAAAFGLAFLIGFSRLYLGAHFVHDVIAGWLVGFILFRLVQRFWIPAGAWLKTKSLTVQVSIAFIVSLIFIAVNAASAARLDGYVFPDPMKTNALRTSEILPDPVSLEGSITSAGSLFGLAFGAVWIASKGGYQVDGSLEKRALRIVIGLIGVVILWQGLGFVFPRGEELIPLILRYIRYTLVGFWVIGGAPGLFFRFKLAKPKI